jgi:hypothetical protein
MRVWTARFVILLAIVASLLKFRKVQSLRNNGVAITRSNMYMPVIQISLRSMAKRALDKGVWAYSSGVDSVEYPVIQGAIMWFTAKVIPHGVNNYFYGSALLLALLFIFISLITFR